MPKCSHAVIKKFLHFLAWRGAWQLGDQSASDVLDAYSAVKRHGRSGVEASIWEEGVKVIGAITPNEVVDFQQCWLSDDPHVRETAFGEEPTSGGRKRKRAKKCGCTASAIGVPVPVMLASSAPPCAGHPVQEESMTRKHS